MVEGIISWQANPTPQETQKYKNQESRCHTEDPPNTLFLPQSDG